MRPAFEERARQRRGGTKRHVCDASSHIAWPDARIGTAGGAGYGICCVRRRVVPTAADSRTAAGPA